MSALLLKNGDFIACVYRGLVDDYVQRAIRNIAQKVFKSGSKKFSQLIMRVGDREASAWDYYCYGLAKGSRTFQDKFISDYLKLAVIKRVEALSEAKLGLMEISACSLMEIDETTVLSSDPVMKLIEAELSDLVRAHGNTLLPEAQPHDLQSLRRSEVLITSEG